MKIKSYFITTLLCIFTLLFATSFVFAGNIGRAVYGVFTETYNGAHFGVTSSDEDAVESQLWDNQSMGGETMNDTPAEGESYSKLTNGTPHPEYEIWKYGGGGYVSKNSNGYHNMSAYYGGNIKFYVRSSDSNMESMKVGVKLAGIEILVPLSDLGFTANGQWHELTFPLTTTTNSNLTATNLANTNILFLFNLPENNYVVGESICFDHIRWIKPGDGSFTATVKNVSDNQVATDDKITWNESCFRQSWIAAQQYIELDLDQEGSNWYVRIYLNNGKESRNGLYCVDSDGSEIVLPMAWRVKPNTLPNGDGDTLQIAEVYHVETNEGRLYDYGKHGNTDPWWYPWIFTIEKNKTLAEGEIEFTKAWDIRGIHTYAYDNEAWNSPANLLERKPKIYFAADCSEALGGLIYRANIVTELVYE